MYSSFISSRASYMHNNYTNDEIICRAMCIQETGPQLERAYFCDRQSTLNTNFLLIVDCLMYRHRVRLRSGTFLKITT